MKFGADVYFDPGFFFDPSDSEIIHLLSGFVPKSKSNTSTYFSGLLSIKWNCVQEKIFEKLY